MGRDLGLSVDNHPIRINGAIGNVGLDAILSRCYNANGACQQIERDSNGFLRRLQGDLQVKLLK